MFWPISSSEIGLECMTDIWKKDTGVYKQRLVERWRFASKKLAESKTLCSLLQSPYRSHRNWLKKKTFTVRANAFPFVWKWQKAKYFSQICRLLSELKAKVKVDRGGCLFVQQFFYSELCSSELQKLTRKFWSKSDFNWRECSRSRTSAITFACKKRKEQENGPFIYISILKNFGGKTIKEKIPKMNKQWGHLHLRELESTCNNKLIVCNEIQYL